MYCIEGRYRDIGSRILCIGNTYYQKYGIGLVLNLSTKCPSKLTKLNFKSSFGSRVSGTEKRQKCAMGVQRNLRLGGISN